MDPVYIPPPKGAARGVADALFAHLRDDLTWLEVTAARKEYFMSSAPRSYRYKTWDGEREYASVPFTIPVQVLMTAIGLLPQVMPDWAAARGLTGMAFNVCFLNRYDTQHGHLGWHADDSPEMSHDHPIAVVSLGAEREIWWKHKAEKGQTPPERRRLLEHGSVFVMPPGFQRDHLHRIPKADHVVGPRISLTFRHYLDEVKEAVNA